MKKTLTVLCLFVLILSIPLSSNAALTNIPRSPFGATPTAQPKNSGISLIIPTGSWGTWKKVSTKKISFTCEVKNTNPTKTVKSYEITYYTCDEYNQQNSPKETVSLRQDIRAYETITTPEFFLTNSKIDNVYHVYATVTYVRYSDGSVERNSNPSYIHWTIKD